MLYAKRKKYPRATRAQQISKKNEFLKVNITITVTTISAKNNKTKLRTKAATGLLSKNRLKNLGIGISGLMDVASNILSCSLLVYVMDLCFYSWHWN